VTYVVTCHQPNYIPGMSVIGKIEAADAVVWLDAVQYSHDGWSNRNRMPDGSWLTVPVERATDMAAFNRVRVSEHGRWRRKHRAALRQHYGWEPVAELCEEIARPYRLLVGLNLALLRILLRGCDAAWHFQSHLDGGHATVAVSDDRRELAPISSRLAMMVAELGGDVYLSGPSGRRYLDERPFRERGIAVRYFAWDGGNPCAVARLTGPRVGVGVARPDGTVAWPHDDSDLAELPDGAQGDAGGSG
jgi:hypothetical protein